MEKHLYAEHFDLESKHWWFVSKKKIIDSFLNKYIPQKNDRKILDAGCGAGLMLNQLQIYGKTYAMDFSEDAVDFSKKNFNGEVKRGWLPENFPYLDQKFDAIICLDVIEHINDDQKSLQILKNHLSDDGVMIITVPALQLLWSKWDDLNHHKRRYNKKLLEQVILDAGLKIVRISYYNSLLFLPVFFIRIMKNIIKSDSEKSDTVLPNFLLNWILEKIFSFEKWLLQVISFPIGVSLIAVVRKN